MAKLSQKYESIMIVNTKLGEDGIQAIVEKFKKLISDHATMESVDEWGKRRLAYPINDEPDGYYVMYTFTSEPSLPAELDRMYKITDGVMRTLIIAKD